jgi:RHH-type proline utilization regulon transcriptional repressor/proline dehydrogenase/delta 1-pyrroline-5-carboxylate dehydrogenase
VAQVAFTGSRAVGLQILEQTSQRHPGQPQVKRVVCEMGGKNAIIVDEDADLDEAVAGVVHSAFDYAGQKCSACSRAILVGPVADAFIPRLIEVVRSLPAGPAHEPGVRLGPVVDDEAHRRLMAVIEAPGAGARLLYRGLAPKDGWFVPPAIFEVSDEGHRLMQEELFGPVLAVYRAPSFEDALRVASGTDYALTGGVFSRDPGHLELSRARFRVGNLYLNRPVTGAAVGRQPFGGFAMSGVGAKAGGPDYLVQFAQPRCVTENTTRHGFTPEV